MRLFDMMLRYYYETHDQRRRTRSQRLPLPLAHIGLARLISGVQWKACRSVAQALKHEGNRDASGTEVSGAPWSVACHSYSLAKTREQSE